MKTKDITLFESGSGGDFSLLNKDIGLSERIYYKVYLSLFGGNTEASTKGDEIQGEERKDWWGNSLFFPGDLSKQFNSETEKILKNVALNSSGRISILEAVKVDLKLFNNISQNDINVVLLNSNSVSIEVKISEPINNSSSILKMVWNNAKNEVITSLLI
jgi:phage gp46-like protein